MFCHQFYHPTRDNDTPGGALSAFAQLLTQLDWEYNLRRQYADTRRQQAGLPITAYPSETATVEICEKHRLYVLTALDSNIETEMTIRIRDLLTV
jgi:hypothetical protein